GLALERELLAAARREGFGGRELVLGRRPPAGARIARVADVVAVPVGLRRVRVRRTVVLRIADAVAVAVGQTGVGRTGWAGPGAVLGDVAETAGRPACDCRGHEAIRRAGVGRPVAGLGDVAHVGCRTTDVGRGLLAVGAGGRRARAEVIEVARPGGGPAELGGELEGVGRTGGSDAVAGLGQIAGSGRCAALETRGAEG